MAVLVLAVLLLLVAVNLQAGWVFAVDALLWGALAVSGAGAWPALRGLRASRTMPAEVFEGDQVTVTLTLSAPRGRRYVLTVRDAVPGFSPGTSVVPVVSSRPASVAYRATALRRGVHRAADVELETSGLLGLVRARARLPAGGDIVVFPRYWILPRLPSGPSHAGSSRRRPLRDGLDVSGVRDYRSGDSLRHVHWRSTARRGRLAVREFEEELHEPSAILLDTRPHLYADVPEAFDDLVRATASVAHALTRSGRPVALLCSADRQARSVRWTDALRWLASVQPGGDRAPADHDALLPPGTRAVVLTADPDAVLSVARRRPVAAVLIDVSAYRRQVAPQGEETTVRAPAGTVLALEALGIPAAVLSGGADAGAVLERWGSWSAGV